MRRGYKVSAKLQNQLDEYIHQDIVPGDKVEIEGQYLKVRTSRDLTQRMVCNVKEIDGDNVIVYNGYKNDDTVSVAKEHVHKWTYNVGANPFVKYTFHKRIKTLNFSMSCIILKLFKEESFEDKRKDGSSFTVGTLNWNPYVYNNKGEREYYQRDLCWTLKDKQMLIDSIYNHINCGQVLIRLKSYDWIREEAEKKLDETIYQFDVVDGKQRLHTIMEFINNEFPDSYGNYWDDLSEHARVMFEDSFAFSYCEMEEQTTDKEVISGFLNLNFTGVPMSGEHIEFVKELNKRI